jgi:hypothetical protein
MKLFNAKKVAIDDYCPPMYLIFIIIVTTASTIKQ